MTATETTPEVSIINKTQWDSDLGREGKVIFKGQQSGGEESTLAEIEAHHHGSSDDEKGSLVIRTNDGSDGASPTERLRIDSGGKTTLTTTSAGASTNPLVLHNASSSANTDVRMLLAPCTTAADRPVILAAENNGSNVCAFTVSTPNGGTPAERLRVDGVGNLLIGTTSVQGAGGTTISSGPQINLVTANANLAQVVQFRNTNGKIGTISMSGSATAYNTSSDYRLKENVTDVTDGITRVKQLAPKRFNFIADADTTVDGFLAHEAQAVVPEAVHGTKDEVDDDDNAVMQGIDQSKLVPLLTAALQEAITKIETLETKVAALEAE